MPEDVTPNTTTTPVPVDTQSAPITGTLTPPAAAPTQLREIQTPTAPKEPPGNFFHNMSRAFSGAVLGAMAGREKVTSYTTDEAGKQTPVTQKMTTGDQLRQIARSALLGLAAGTQTGPHKSALGAFASGAGAGADDAIARAKQQDLLKRKQSTEEYERGQQSMLNKAQNAHIAIETMRGIQELRNSTLDTQSKFATLGQDAVAAAVAGGNAVPVQDMHMDEIMKYREEHPEYLNFTPVLTKAVPKENADPSDPSAVDRYYSLIDYTKPVEVTPAMVGHLRAVGFPGAESLEPGQKIDPMQFKGLWYQGLKMYNTALLDPKNKDVIDVTMPDGNVAKAVYNKTLGTTEILRDPETQKPLGGKVETDQSRIVLGDGKTHQVLVNKQNGKFIKDLGEAGTAADNQVMRTFGDYSKTGQAYLATVEQPIRNDIKMIGDYQMEPAAMGRGGATRPAIMSGVGQYNPNFEERNYNTRYDYQRKFLDGSSPDGAARSRINTAIGHLDLLGQAAEGIAKNDLTAINKLAAEYGFQTDKPGPVLYNLVADKAAAEAAAATGSTTEKEIETQRKNLRLEAGPIQQREQIAGNIALLKTQVDTINNNFKQAMGQDAESLGNSVVYPQNRAILDKWSLRPQGPPAGATHSRLAADGRTTVYLMPDKTVQDASGGKYDPKTLQRIQ